MMAAAMIDHGDDDGGGHADGDGEVTLATKMML